MISPIWYRSDRDTDISLYRFNNPVVGVPSPCGNVFKYAKVTGDIFTSAIVAARAMRVYLSISLGSVNVPYNALLILV